MPKSLKDIICQSCPNGCNLLFREMPDGRIELSNNRCIKAIDFSKNFLADDQTFINQKNIFCKEKLVKYSFSEVASILNKWDIVLSKIHPLINIEGSPERTQYREVIEDRSSKLYILEKIAKNVLSKKIFIAETLSFLKINKLDYVRPYLKSINSLFIEEINGKYFQLVNYVDGVDLDRQQYLYDKWRGPLLADFLVNLHDVSENILQLKINDSFSLKDYILKLIDNIRIRKPEILPRVENVISFLSKQFFDVYDSIPSTFCHGDFHPLNIIWGEDSVKYVIDWEFCGIKPEIYDVSNMIGCLGVEHPASLKGEFVLSFIERLKDKSKIADISWKYLTEFIIAMRFAWLSEWLRKSDNEMIELELDYFDLLIENQQYLVKNWGI